MPTKVVLRAGLGSGGSPGVMLRRSRERARALHDGGLGGRRRTFAVMPSSTADTRPHVVIAGGGVAALEALLALREIAGDRLRLTLVARDRHFAYRPMAVAQPFCLGHAERHELAAIAQDADAEFLNTAVIEVLADEHQLRLVDGTKLPYDSLLVATGARGERPFHNAITFGADGAPEALTGLVADLELAYVRRVAFVAPTRDGWTLPLYELAVMTARDVMGNGHRRRRADDRDAGAAPARRLRDRAEHDGLRVAGRGRRRVRRRCAPDRRPRCGGDGRAQDRGRPGRHADDAARPCDPGPARTTGPASSRSTSSAAPKGSRTSTPPAT